jgi:hypothetical protein
LFDLHLPAAPQSESKLHVPSGALAHLLDLHFAPPQSESKLQDAPGAFAHLPDLHFTPPPQSESKLQARAGRENNDAASTRSRIMSAA